MEIRIIEKLPYEEVVTLLHESFSERLEQGLNFACATFTCDELIKHISKNAIAIGAYDDTDKLVGIVFLNHIRQKFNGIIRYANHEYLAVSSTMKGRGVGTLLFKELKNIAKDLNLDFVLSNTADRAESSIRLHKKNGFITYGKCHYPNRTYDSYNFCCPISIKGRILSLFPFRLLLKFLHQ